MDAIGQIIERNGQLLVKQAGESVAADIADILLSEEQFVADNPSIGEPLGEVEPLSALRVMTKKGFGYRYTSIPRMATGALQASIESHADGLKSEVSTSNVAAFTQQHGGGPWTDEFGHPAPYTPARPFFGVSDRALSDVQSLCDSTAKQIETEFSALAFNVTVTIKAG